MIYLPGHRGMVGSAVLRRLQANGQTPLTRTRSELDLCDQAAVRQFFQANDIDTVIFCAARVGGIHANNTYPAEFCHENLAMATNTIQAAFESGVQRFLFLGSTCIYPRDCAPTDPGIRPPNRPFGENQRGVCLGQDRGLEDVRVLSSSIRRAVSLGHAHEPIRSRPTTTIPRTATSSRP